MAQCELGSDGLDYILERTGDLIGKHWFAVQQIALALARYGELSGTQVEALLGPREGAFSPAKFGGDSQPISDAISARWSGHAGGEVVS